MPVNSKDSYMNCNVDAMWNKSRELPDNVGSKPTASEICKPRYMTMVCTDTMYRHNTHHHLRT